MINQVILLGKQPQDCAVNSKIIRNSNKEPQMFDLYIGNKNYSSWSLRPWLLMKHFGIPFNEHMVSVAGRDYNAALKPLAGNARVPCLHEDGFQIWESIAIAETLAERHPAMWPADARAAWRGTRGSRGRRGRRWPRGGSAAPAGGAVRGVCSAPAAAWVGVEVGVGADPAYRAALAITTPTAAPTVTASSASATGSGSSGRIRTPSPCAAPRSPSGPRS